MDGSVVFALLRKCASPGRFAKAAFFFACSAHAAKVWIVLPEQFRPEEKIISKDKALRSRLSQLKNKAMSGKAQFVDETDKDFAQDVTSYATGVATQVGDLNKAESAELLRIIEELDPKIKANRSLEDIYNVSSDSAILLNDANTVAYRENLKKFQEGELSTRALRQMADGSQGPITSDDLLLMRVARQNLESYQGGNEAQRAQIVQENSSGSLANALAPEQVAQYMNVLIGVEGGSGAEHEKNLSDMWADLKLPEEKFIVENPNVKYDENGNEIPNGGLVNRSPSPKSPPIEDLASIKTGSDLGALAASQAAANAAAGTLPGALNGVATGAASGALAPGVVHDKSQPSSASAAADAAKDAPGSSAAPVNRAPASEAAAPSQPATPVAAAASPKKSTASVDPSAIAAAGAGFGSVGAGAVAAAKNISNAALENALAQSMNSDVSPVEFFNADRPPEQRVTHEEFVQAYNAYKLGLVGRGFERNLASAPGRGAEATAPVERSPNCTLLPKALVDLGRQLQPCLQKHGVNSGNVNDKDYAGTVKAGVAKCGATRELDAFKKLAAACRSDAALPNLEAITRRFAKACMYLPAFSADLSRDGLISLEDRKAQSWRYPFEYYLDNDGERLAKSIEGYCARYPVGSVGHEECLVHVSLARDPGFILAAVQEGEKWLRSENDKDKSPRVNAKNMFLLWTARQKEKERNAQSTLAKNAPPLPIADLKAIAESYRLEKGNRANPEGLCQEIGKRVSCDNEYVKAFASEYFDSKARKQVTDSISKARQHVDFQAALRGEQALKSSSDPMDNVWPNLWTMVVEKDADFSKSNVQQLANPMGQSGGESVMQWLERHPYLVPKSEEGACDRVMLEYEILADLHTPTLSTLCGRYKDLPPCNGKSKGWESGSRHATPAK